MSFQRYFVWIIHFLVSFYLLPSHAVVHFFDLGDITAKGKVTSYPSSLGWIEPGFSFSASASVLEQKSFDFNSTSFGTSTEPLGVKPTVLASGLGQSWGGWSMVVVNQSSTINTRSEGEVVGESSQNKNNFYSSTLGVYLGSGKRLSENWSIGWNLNFFQTNEESHLLNWKESVMEKLLVSTHSLSKIVGVNMGMGFIFDNDSITFGMHLITPSAILKNTGIKEVNSLDQTFQMTHSTEEQKISANKNNFVAEYGLRFGKDGFVYLVSDEYSFVGSHKINLGFEFVGSWGTVATGYSHFDYDQKAKDKVLVGFAKTKGNFRWAVGPYLESELLKGDNGYNARSFGVLYASEIKY